MRSKPAFPILSAAALLAVSAQAHSATATFDDLPTPPAVTSATSLPNANNGGLTYSGATWDPLFSVVGDEYRISSTGPLFGIPHSGHYFLSNGNGEDGLTIATSQILTGAWFGRNEYYGFGGGADQITLVALSGNTVLQSVVFDLPETHPGQPEPLSFVDTSAFAALSGITGYRIDRHAPGPFANNWVADDFQFSPANPVPEPGTGWLFGLALAGLGRFAKRRGG
jgi:hypothetical protein